jgi:hypothetical protein
MVSRNCTRVEIMERTIAVGSGGGIPTRRYLNSTDTGLLDVKICPDVPW